MNEVDSKYDLKSLLEKYRVVIPLIQRDYAQGRTDIRTTEVRRKLLIDINSALINKETVPLDLNFIYGKSSNGNFIPLDGQQRLTTLFLVYLYAFRGSDDCKFLRNFLYETRDSSKQFFKSLYEHRLEIFTQSLNPSEVIKDAAWFADSWKLDPTIQGVLVTLDSIPKYFDSKFNYDFVLSSSEERKVIFNFLDIDELGSEDELYIKLNSRGRPLTDFENFKARFIARVSELDDKLANDIALKLDTKWTDVIWKLNKDKFDTNFLNVFEISLINNLDSLDYSKRDNWTSTISFEDIELKHVQLIVTVLDFLSDDEYPEVKLILERTIVNKSLKDRVYFHVISKYLEHSGTVLDDKFDAWYRIFRNLIENSEIDYQEPYERAINGINEQILHTSNLLQFLSENNRITGFSREQVDEEIEKAKLISSNSSFAQLIYTAEKHPYFSGQIRSSFYFNLDDSPSEKMLVIDSYWKKINSIFEDGKVGHGILLRTALLSYGDYTVEIDSYKTLCQDDPNENSSTPSLKRLFSMKNKFVKMLLDDIDISVSLQGEYTRIIQKNLSSIDLNDWRYPFICHYDAMFKRMSPTQYRLKAPSWGDRPDEMLLIPNKNSRARNFDIHLIALWEKLKEYKINARYESEPGLYTTERILYVNELYEVRFYKDHFSFKKTGEDKNYKLMESPASFLKLAEHLKESISGM